MSKIRELFGTFFKIGAFTFGGGYAMVALLEHEFVEEKRWLTREEFLDMVAIAESTPGPVAVNSATYIGYKLAGVAGAAASTLAVCLPSFAVIYLISLFFDRFLQLTVVVNEDSHSQLLQARNATAQDVGIVFSYSGQTMEMIQCIKEMKAGGAPVIAVTRYYPSEVAQLADHVLYVAANESLFRNGAMSSRLSQLNVMDILYTAYASRNHEDTMRRLTKTHIYKPGDPEVLTQP